MSDLEWVRRDGVGRWEAEGSGPSNLARAIYDTPAASAPVAANNGVALNFGSLSSGDALLDLSDPTRPTVLAEGVYAVTAIVNYPVAATDAHQVRIEMELDADGADVDAASFFYADAAKGFYGSVSNTYFIPVGGAMSVTATHFDSAAHAFGINVTIQRVA